MRGIGKPSDSILEAARATTMATVMLTLAIAHTVSAYSCTTAMDCELLGACVSGACVCRNGWKGDSCGTLDLTPIAAPANPSAIRGAIWPPTAALLDNSTFSWGFTVVYDDTTSLYHAAVNVGCCGLGKDAHWPTGGTCGVTVGGTFLLHLTSKHPDRGFTQTGIFVGPTAFNPHLIRAPNGTFILYFRVNDKASYAACTGSGPRQNSSDLETYIPASDITHTDPSGEGPGANMYVSSATSMKGPWTTTRVVISGMGDLHISNPSIALLADGKRTLLAYRFNPHGGEQNGFALATSYRGPFASSANLTKASGNDEDPFVWEEKGGRNDKSLHILYHNGPHGFHAFSPDGSEWRKSPTHSYAFTRDIAMAGAATFGVARRERPELLFDAAGEPQFLFNGVNTHTAALPSTEEGNFTGLAHGGFSHALSFVQSVNSKR